MYNIKCYRNKSDMDIDAFFTRWTTDCPTTKGAIVGQYIQLGHLVRVEHRGKVTVYSCGD